MAEINNDEKRITVSGEQIEEAVGKVPTIEADVKSNKQNISALQTASAQHTADIAKNTADIKLKANAEEVYSREETDNAITAKVAEIVSGAPEEFDTLKEMSDWLTEHSDSAATMNTAIQANTKAIADNATAIEGNTADIEQNKSDILIVNSLVVYCKNLIPQDVAIGYYADSTGAPTENTAFIRAVNYPKVKPNVKYTMSSNLPIYSVWYFNGDTAISRENIKETTRTITIPENCNNIRISLQKPSSSSGTSEFKWLQVEEGEVVTEFTPYVPSLQNQINALVERIAALETAQTQNE